MTTKEITIMTTTETFEIETFDPLVDLHPPIAILISICFAS